MQWRSVARHVGHRPLYGAYEAGGINPPLKLLCAVVLRLCWLGAMHANLASSDSLRPAPRIAACDSKLVVHKKRSRPPSRWFIGGSAGGLCGDRPGSYLSAPLFERIRGHVRGSLSLTMNVVRFLCCVLPRAWLALALKALRDHGGVRLFPRFRGQWFAFIDHGRGPFSVGADGGPRGYSALV